MARIERVPVKCRNLLLVMDWKGGHFLLKLLDLLQGWAIIFTWGSMKLFFSERGAESASVKSTAISY